MQDEINEKVIVLSIRTAELTAETLIKAAQTVISKAPEHKSKGYHGKQTLKQLIGQNAGVSSIDVAWSNIKDFESVAKKYGVDYAVKKDSRSGRYLVFFKGRDADVITAALSEFSAKKLEKKESITEMLRTLTAKSAPDKSQEREVSL